MVPSRTPRVWGCEVLSGRALPWPARLLRVVQGAGEGVLRVLVRRTAEAPRCRADWPVIVVGLPASSPRLAAGRRDVGRGPRVSRRVAGCGVAVAYLYL